MQNYRQFTSWLNEAKRVREEDDEVEVTKKGKAKVVVHDGDEDGSRVTEELKGKQHKLDKNKNGRLDAHDFELLRKEEEELDEAQYGVNLGSRPVSGQKEYQGKEIKSFHPNKEKEAREFAKKHGYVVKKKMLAKDGNSSITHTWDIHKEEVELEEADQKIKVTDVKSALKNVKNASSHTKKMIKANPTQKMPYDSSRHAAYSEEFELDEAFKPGDKVTYETSKYSKDNKGVVHSVDGEYVTVKGHDMLGKPHHIEVHQGFVKKLKEDVELDEAIKLNSKIVIHDPGESHHGKVGYVGEIRHGAYKGAPKTYTVDYDHNEETGRAKSIQLDKKNIKQVKESVELDEANFADTMKKAIAAHERGDHARAKYHLDNAKTARYAMKSTEISKNKDLLDKYKELSAMHEGKITYSEFVSSLYEAEDWELKKIHGEYKHLKSLPTSDVLKKHKAQNRVSASYSAAEMGGKEGLISDIMRNRHGQKRMDAYHALPKKHKDALSEELDLVELDEAMSPQQDMDFKRMMAGAMSRDEYNKKWKKGKYAQKSGKYKLDPTGVYHNLIKTVGEEVELSEAKIPVQHATDAVHKVLGQKSAVKFLTHLRPSTEKHTSWDKVNDALVKQGVKPQHIASIATHVRPAQYEEVELDEAIDPGEIASNVRAYHEKDVKKAYYHKSATDDQKHILAKRLDTVHGKDKWRKPVKEEIDLNEVTQGVEHSEWADNVKEAHPGVKIIKNRDEDGRHKSSHAILNGKKVGQYNMNTGVGTFKKSKTYQEEVEIEEGIKSMVHSYLAKRAGKKADDAYDMGDEKEFQKQVDKSEYHRVKAGGKPTRINKNPDAKFLTTREEVDLDESVKIIDRDSDLDQEHFKLSVNGKPVHFVHHNYEGGHATDSKQDIHYQVKNQLKHLSDTDKKKVTDTVHASYRMKEEVELDEGQTVKTSTGYVHKGSYGSEYDTDEEGNEKKKTAPAVKRGRGRPKKGSDETGEVKKYTFHDLLNRLSR